MARAAGSRRWAANGNTSDVEQARRAISRSAPAWRASALGIHHSSFRALFRRHLID